MLGQALHVDVEIHSGDEGSNACANVQSWLDGGYELLGLAVVVVVVVGVVAESRTDLDDLGVHHRLSRVNFDLHADGDDDVVTYVV